jgi:hypothetical protein
LGRALKFPGIRGFPEIKRPIRGRDRADLRVLARTFAMGFFDSDIVQQEAKQLFEDYQSLVQLGSKYGKFDREGKKQYIERMEEMMERYRVFMKRFELSEDFMAQMTVQQLNTQLNQFGMTPQQMFDRMHDTLERMKSELEQQP